MGEDTQELRARLANMKNEIANVLETKKDGGFGGNSNNGDITPLRLRRNLRGHFGKVYAMHWAGRGAHSDYLVSASQDGKLIIWNGNSTNKVQAIPLRSSWVMTCAFEQGQNKLVACGGLDNVCTIYTPVFDGTAGLNSRPVKELSGHDGYLPSCRFLSPSKIITSSGDSSCIQWDIPSGSAVRQFHDHSGDVMSVAPNPHNENLFVSGSVDLTCKLWDIRASSGCVFTFHGHESDVNSVDFFPSGNAFGTASDDSTCRLFDLRCYQEVNSYVNDKILCGITSVAFSASGRLLFGGNDDGNVIAWDTIKDQGDSTEYAYPMSKHEDKVTCLGVHSEGKALCSGSWDTSLRVWA